MPTENRSSNTEIVSVPPYIGLEPLVGRYYPAQCRRCGWVGSSEELTEDDAQCTRDVGDRLCLGDCDELERHDLLNIIQAMAQYHQGEPVAEVRYMGYEPTNHLNWLNGNDLQLLPDGTKLYIRPLQGEAVTLPARWTDNLSDWARGWNACLDEIAKLGPLYTHADPGEVERLRTENAQLRNEDLKWQGLRQQEREIISLRAQLAERDALLASAKQALCHLLHNIKISGKRIDLGLAKDSADTVITLINALQIGADLSASAEPSAPVGRDELKPCPFCGCHVTVLTGSEDIRIIGSHGKACPFLDLDVIVDGRDGWQARAALERKPSCWRCNQPL